MTQTIRDLIKDRRDEIRRASDLLPERAAELLVELTALLGNCLDIIREREMNYNRVLQLSFDTEEKANRAKIKAQATPDYEALKEARDSKELLKELISSLKYFLREKEDEKRKSIFMK